MPWESCEHIKQSSADTTSGATDSFALWHKALKLYFEISIQIYFIACAQTLEFYILSSKEYNILKYLSVDSMTAFAGLRWPTLLVCLDHPYLKFASTKLLALGTNFADQL